MKWVLLAGIFIWEEIILKRFVSFVLVMSILSAIAASAGAAPGAKEITVIVDGVKQNYSAKPVNVKGSVLVPMRAIFETLQAKGADWRSRDQIDQCRCSL